MTWCYNSTIWCHNSSTMATIKRMYTWLSLLLLSHSGYSIWGIMNWSNTAETQDQWHICFVLNYYCLLQQSECWFLPSRGICHLQRTHRGLTHSGNSVIFKPVLDENDFYIFNQKDIAYDRHFDLIHFPDMRSSLLYVNILKLK